MSTTTENLGLLKKDPTQDGNDTFNIQTMLNDNWDKIDEAMGNVPKLEEDGMIPKEQIPALDYIPAEDKGKAGGVAELGADGKVPSGQMPRMDYLPLSGGHMTGPIDMGGNAVTNLPTPTNGSDAATKQYVDSKEVDAYTKAQTLTPYDATKLGIPGGLPKDMFGVLADVGKLHVWKKYVTSAEETTYEVSTNRNAYQDSPSAGEIPARYELGAVKNGFLIASSNRSNSAYFKHSDTLNVEINGDLSQVSPTTYTANALNESWIGNIQEAIRGKFVVPISDGLYGYSQVSGLVYVPDDAVVTYFENGTALGYPYNYGFAVSKMQPVTGYPAIPATTQYTYLGPLGAKSQVQVLSYVGTGTYGASNPCGVTADFPIKVLMVVGLTMETNQNHTMIGSLLTESYVSNKGFIVNSNSGYGNYGKKSSDGKTFYWYNTKMGSAGLNESGKTYTFIAIG